MYHNPISPPVRIIKPDQDIRADPEIRIEVVDEPGSSGCSDQYRIKFPYLWNKAASGDPPVMVRGLGTFYLKFQHGHAGDDGPNGISEQALLAILVDRLKCRAAGPYRDKSRMVALAHLETALGHYRVSCGQPQFPDSILPDEP